MQAVILAGGLGTRLRPLTYPVPKPMLPVGNRPALALTIDALVNAGCGEVIVTTNYLAEVVEAGIVEMNSPIPVRCIQEDKPLGTAGCIKNCIDQLGDEFLVIMGDAVADIDYRHLIEFHHAKKADVTIAVMRVEDTREFGIVALDDDRRITRFQEKPRPEEAFSDLANAGFYVLKRDVFDYVPPGVPFDFSRDLVPRLMEQDRRFYAWALRSYWFDIGRIGTYLESNQQVIAGRTEIGPGAVIPDSATLVPPFLIASRVRIGDDCVIGPGTVLGERCIIGAQTNIARSVVYQDVSIGAGARLNDCVVAKGSRLGNNVSIEPRAVIGERCIVGDGAQVSAYSRVGPLQPVQAGATVSGEVSPSLEQLERIRRAIANERFFRDLPPDQRWVCVLLAEFGEMTARALAEVGSIPYSRIHSILHQLETHHIVLSTPDVPKRYALTREVPNT
ncbi:MAG: sugar phosphate nucleotidyltransferase [Armatimonadota bacterium]|nr:sugar phosphate nucleotidyltransferase [Armatimonadota bacterium]